MTAQTITKQLERYGILYKPEAGFEPENFHEVKFALYFLKNPAYLPALDTLLAQCDPAELIDRDTTALMWAMKHLSYEKLLLLAKKPAFIKQYIHAADHEGQTVIHYFADNRDADVRTMEQLIALGADINAVDALGWTALHHFAYYENDECAHALFKYKPKIVTNAKGHTPADIERMGSDDRMPFTDIWRYEE